jgi:hypothetical protein
MPGFAELASYHLPWALLVGTFTALAFAGTGRGLLSLLGVEVPRPLRLPVGVLLGVLVASALVQVLAFGHLATPRVMRALWAVLLAAGGAGAVAGRAVWAEYGGALRELGAARIWILPFAVFSILLLLASAAPVTRSDELGYHTLVTARVLADGALRVYPLPWEASVWPQFGWHYALVPLYAVAGSAAGGVVSAWLALVLAFTTGRLIVLETASAVWGVLGAFIVLASGYAVVFFTTPGPHAFEALGTFTAVATVGGSRQMLERAPLRGFVWAIAVGMAAAICGKVTMLPLMAVVLGIGLTEVWRTTPLAHERIAALATFAAVPALALLPLALWGWFAAHSPLGALSAGLLKSPLFDPESMAAYLGTREIFGDSFGWRFEAAYWGLPLAAGVVAALLLDASPERRRRWWLIFGCQVLIIACFLPKEIRHLGGLQYALFASGFSALATRFAQRKSLTGWPAAITALAVLPWAAFFLWTFSIYLPFLTGRQSALQFVERYAGLEADFQRLDRILPRDAILLIGRSRTAPQQYAWYARPPVYYAPRPILFRSAEVSPGQRVYLLYLGAGNESPTGIIPLDPWLPAGSALGATVYTNPTARFYPSRTPQGGAGLARLDVIEVVPGRIPLAP